MDKPQKQTESKGDIILKAMAREKGIDIKQVSKQVR